MKDVKKAFFVCYGGGHAEALIPVMKYLIANTSIKVDAIGINLAAEKLRMNGIPCKSLSNYLDIKSVEIGFSLAKEKHNFGSPVSFADSIAYYGFTMGDLIDEIGEKDANEVLRIFDRRTMFPAQTMTRILKIEKPDVVITTTMNRFEAATLYAAGSLGIPSVKVEDLIGRINKTYPDKIQVNTLAEKEELIQNGIKESSIILKDELNSSAAIRYCEKIYNIQLNLRPTAFAVFCNYAKEDMISRGIPQESIYVTGQPAFDNHPIYLESTNRKEVFEELGLNLDKKLIVFMSQPIVEREEVLNMIFTAVKEYSLLHYQFLIKLHPNENGEIQRIILEKYRIPNVKICKDVDVKKILAVSDLIMTVSSTTGLEAAVMEKPLLYIKISNGLDDIPFDEMGIGVPCTNSKEISMQINNILNEKIELSANKLKEYASDSNAAKRVANIVELLANKKIKPRKKVDIIVQARMGSSRLPGKVMMLYCGIPQIQHVVDRMKYSRLATDILVATSTCDNNNILKEYFDNNNIRWYEGSEENVLERYINAAETLGTEVVVRVTTDNPLTSAVCIDMMIESHLQKNADFTFMESLPLGVTAEVVNLEILKKIAKKKDLSKEDLEHVTIYIYNHPDEFSINVMSAPDEISNPEISLTVDTEEDYQHMSYIYEKLYKDDYINIQDVISLLKSNKKEI